MINLREHIQISSIFLQRNKVGYTKKKSKH